MSTGSDWHNPSSLESSERLASSGIRLMMPPLLQLQLRLLIKFRHVAADKSLIMQSAKTEFMNGIRVGYHSNNNADKKTCPGGIHKRWASCLNQPLDRNVVLFLHSVSLSILRAALQCGKLENSSWDYGRIN